MGHPVASASVSVSGTRGKAEKYSLRDDGLHGCRVKYCSIRLFVTALP